MWQFFCNHELRGRDLQHSWNLHCPSTKNENFTEDVNSLASVMKSSIWTSESETISCGLWFRFSSQSKCFSRCGWVVRLPAYPTLLLFALCNLMRKILSAAQHSYCFLKCLYVVALCQLVTTIAGQCQSKNIWRKFVFQPTYPTFLSYLNNICFVLFKIDQKNADQLQFFSTSFWLQASAVLVNKVNMLLRWLSIVI